jgi:hypothetical protein
LQEVNMKEPIMDRKGFLRCVGSACVGSCLCVTGLRHALAEQSETAPPAAETAPGADTPARAVKRMEFSDAWVTRVMAVLDSTRDADSRPRVITSNGRACFREWIESTGRQITPVSFDTWAASARERPLDGVLSVEGNVIVYQYESSAETGQSSPEGICLCPMVESIPAGLSPTYCLCSVGYVTEWIELLFGRACEVELIESVLRGAPRCRFKITVA